MTAVSSLLRVDEGLGLFQVSRRAFTDGGLMEREYAAVFDTCWLYLGHESELRKPGDFVTRTVARRNILFTRDPAGTLHALFNTCPHRGATVCREAKGNAKVFQCFVNTIHRVAKGLRTGTVWANCYQVMDPAIPFGGYKMSGFGRESGQEHMQEYLQTKAVVLKLD